MTFYGWRVVAGAFVVLCLAYGTQYSFGIFFAALLDEFGWSRAGLSGVFSLYVFAYTAFGFAAGPGHARPSRSRRAQSSW